MVSAGRHGRTPQNRDKRRREDVCWREAEKRRPGAPGWLTQREARRTVKPNEDSAGASVVLSARSTDARLWGGLAKHRKSKLSRPGWFPRFLFEWWISEKKTAERPRPAVLEQVSAAFWAYVQWRHHLPCGSSVLCQSSLIPLPFGRGRLLSQVCHLAHSA